MNNLFNKVFGIIILLLFTVCVSADTNKPGGDVIHVPSTSTTSWKGYDQFFEDHSLTILIVSCVIYYISLLYARYIWIFMPNNRYLRAYAEEVDAQLVIEQENPATENNLERKVIPAIKKLLNQVDKLAPEKNSLYQGIFAATGNQLAGWRHVHRAKIFATDLYSASDACAQAAFVSKQLIKLKPYLAAEELTKKIDKELESRNPDIAIIKSFTKRGQELLFNERDNYFESLANWQNRATWLVFVSLLILIVLGLTHGNTALFVLGAVGGLLVRMRKVLSARQHAFDYGASWSTLFLAPIVGALTGWAGVLIVLVLSDIGVLGTIFENMLDLNNVKDMPWREITITKEIMALAIAFGFSATFFESVIETFEGKVQEKPASVESEKKAKT